MLAQVTENVRDSATGGAVLIPQGARLIGRYDNGVGYGQKRAFVVWQRLLFPDGSSLRLDNMPAGDAAGYGGLSDRVDGHSWQLIKGVVLSSILGIGTQLSFGGEGGIVRALRGIPPAEREPGRRADRLQGAQRPADDQGSARLASARAGVGGSRSSAMERMSDG